MAGSGYDFSIFYRIGDAYKTRETVTALGMHLYNKRDIYKARCLWRICEIYVHAKLEIITELWRYLLNVRDNYTFRDWSCLVFTESLRYAKPKRHLWRSRDVQNSWDIYRIDRTRETFAKLGWQSQTREIYRTLDTLTELERHLQNVRDIYKTR